MPEKRKDPVPEQGFLHLHERGNGSSLPSRKDPYALLSGGTNNYIFPPLPGILFPPAPPYGLVLPPEFYLNFFRQIINAGGFLPPGVIRTNADVLEYWDGETWLNFGDSLSTSDPGGGKTWLEP